MLCYVYDDSMFDHLCCMRNDIAELTSLRYTDENIDILISAH